MVILWSWNLTVLTILICYLFLSRCTNYLSKINSLCVNKSTMSKFCLPCYKLIMYWLKAFDQLQNALMESQVAITSSFVCRFFNGAHFSSLIPLGVYLATKVYMYTTWFLSFWPYILLFSVLIATDLLYIL